MAKIMTASRQDQTFKPMTNKQIEEAVSRLRCVLQRHRGEVDVETAQEVLGDRNLGYMLADGFRSLCYSRAKMLKCALRIDGQEETVYIVSPEGLKYATTLDEILAVYEANDLEPVEGRVVDVLHIQYPRLVSLRRYYTVWQNAGGVWCHTERFSKSGSKTTFDVCSGIFPGDGCSIVGRKRKGK